MYGHADKQPPFLPWRTGLGPWTCRTRWQALRARRGRRWLLDLRRAHGTARAARARHAARTHRHPDRVRGRVRVAGAAEYVEHLSDRMGGRRAGRLPRLRCRQLRAAVDDDDPSWHVCRDTQGPDPDRRRALGAVVRHRAVIVPHPPERDGPPRGLQHGASDASGRPVP